MPLFACFAIQPRVRLCDRCTELPLSCTGLHKLYARKINYKSSRTRMCATAPPLPLNAFDAVMMGFRLRSRARESVLPSRSRRVFELSVCGKLASLDNAQTNAADAKRPTHNWGDAVRNRLMPGRLATHNVRSLPLRSGAVRYRTLINTQHRRHRRGTLFIMILINIIANIINVRCRRAQHNYVNLIK